MNAANSNDGVNTDSDGEADVPAIRLKGLTKRFGDVVAVDDLELDIREGEFFSLLGPSGCGKTTTLRMMAGFEEPDAGSILLRGDDVTDTPPNKRNVNLVFQHYELFPHMSVAENVAYGLKLRKVKEPELSQRVDEALAIVRVGELAERGAKELSGGQQQRVALARAIVNRPAVLLLDEPLSALDVKLRKQMQLELKAIQHELGTTFVYVTHDQEEALLMSDRIGVMEGGHLLQVASPREIYEHPSDAFVADFIGSLNVIDAIVSAAAEDGSAWATPDTSEDIVEGTRLAFSARGPRPGSRVRIAVRPERISVVAAALDDERAVPADIEPADTAMLGSVENVVYAGSLTRYIISAPGGASITCERTSDGSLRDIADGSSVWLSWPPDAAFVLPGDDERPGGGEPDLPVPAVRDPEEG